MKPDTRSPGGDMPAQQQTGPVPVPASSSTAAAEDKIAQREAAANVLRHKIDTLYGGHAVASPQPTEIAQPSLETENPYQRTHNPHPLPDAEQWKAYHSAWQQYYQQYYSQFYRQQPKVVEPKPESTEPASGSHFFTRTHPDPEPESTEDVSRDEALYELRQKLLGRVQQSATKLRRSRHFVPILASVIVVLIFVFLQYNRVFIANVQAYVSPGSVDPQNIVIDPTADVIVGEESRLIIPKINVDVPALYDVGTDNASQMKAMEQGVAHFPIPGANSHPGEVGNTVLSGHSSNDLFDVGDYKFIFAQLEKLAVGDTLYANYQGTRYTYVITKTEVVKPNEVSKLVYPTDKPVMTLITCTPLGTALNRLLVTAEQVSPDPTQANAAPSGSGEAGSETSPIPGSSPTFIERIFGA